MEEPQQSTSTEVQTAHENIEHPTTIESIEIFAKTTKGENIPIKVKVTDTINDIKTKIQEKDGLLTDQQKLTFGDVLLDDEQSLSHYSITNESTLNLKMLNETMRICVSFYKPDKGYIDITLDVSGSDTIKNVKEKIVEKEGIAVERQMLYLKYKKLEDDRALSNYDIENESTLDLEAGIQIFVKTFHE